MSFVSDVANTVTSYNPTVFLLVLVVHFSMNVPAVVVVPRCTIGSRLQNSVSSEQSIVSTYFAVLGSTSSFVIGFIILICPSIDTILPSCTRITSPTAEYFDCCIPCLEYETSLMLPVMYDDTGI